MEYIGGENADVLTAASGESNNFSGGGGNDTLTGGSGTDTAIYAGTSAGYRVSYGDGQWTVTDVDLADGDTGADTLSGVEQLQFGDGIISLGRDGEFQSNSTGSGEQREANIAALADGGFVVTWTSRDGDAEDGLGIYGQCYAADGTALGGEFRANSTIAGSQRYHSVAGLVDGGFVVCWSSEGQDGDGLGAYAQRYTADGLPVGGEFPINSTTAGLQAHPSVAALADGGFVVSWHASDAGGSSDINAQRYGADGGVVGTEFRVNTATAGEQAAPCVTALVGGGFVVCWHSGGQDGSSHGVYAQRYAEGGMPLGAEFRVNSTTANTQYMPSIAALDDGGFVASWMSDLQDGSGYGVYAQRYAADGMPAGAEFQVNATTANSQSSPILAGLADGGFVVSWTSFDQDGSGLGIYAQRYAVEGVAVGGEFQVNAMTANTQGEAGIAGLADGGFALAWMSFHAGGDILVRRYDDAGNPWLRIDGDEGDNTLSLSSAAPVTFGGGAGDDSYIIERDDQRVIEQSDDGNDTVHALIDHALGANLERLVLAGIANLRGTGNALANELIGNDGANVLDGLAGADTLHGGAGNDIYRVADDGDRVVESSPEGGTDKVISRVSFMLGANVEKLTLAGTAAINATGNALANVLAGNGAANVLNGRAGADTMSGGAGDDSYYVDNADDVVRESRAIWGSDSVFSSVSYTLGSFVERLELTGVKATSATGNALANELVGNGAANVLHGAGGEDILDGRRGADELTGGSGADRFVFDSVAASTGRAFDTITDFERRSDKIDLSRVDADAGTAGLQHFTFIRAAEFGADATGQLRIATVDGKLMLHGSTDADAAAEFAIQLLGTTALAGGDLIL